MIDDGDITEYRGHRIAPCAQSRQSLDVQRDTETVRCGLRSLADAALWIDQHLAPPRRTITSSGPSAVVVPVIHIDHDFVLLAS